MEEKMEELKKIINKVQDYVEKEKYSYIVPEHLFFVLLSDKKCEKMIFDLTSDEECVEKLKTISELYIARMVEKTDNVANITPTNAYSKIIQNTISLCAMRSNPPNSLNLFAGLFLEKEGNASIFFLTSVGITEEKVQEYIREKRKEKDENNENGFLAKYSVNLVQLAKDGKIDPLVGREKEVERVIQVLSKRRSNNPIICGENGTGKTAVVEGLALKIANGDVPTPMKNKIVYALDMAGMLAGARYRGEFEERLQNVIKEIIEKKNIILFIDEIHNVCGAGSNDGTFDASNILKPYLSKGELHCIGATTYDEYKTKILKDKAFARRFKKIDCIEPSKEETVKILMGLEKHYKSFHNVSFGEEIIKYIVDLSDRFLTDKFFPDKAVDIMDEIGAKYHSGIKQGTEATKEDVESVISSIANIPKISVEENEKDKLKNLANSVKSALFGQDEIVDKMVRQINMSKAGLANVGKPISALLCGPTGVGKTEFAKRLASSLGINFVKLDMSEYSEEYSVSRLIGSSAGYVGYEQAGALTEPLIKNPHSVVLLDEIEKADDSVYNLLLQVLDEGKLTDNHNREASFRNAIVLMTTNVGFANAEQTKKNLGFVPTDKQLEDKKAKILKDELKEHFSPEFRNRLTNIFYFNSLSDESMALIVDKNIKRINQCLAEKGVVVEISEKAKKWIVSESLKENCGGRPVERIVDTEISEKVSEEVLFGELENGGKVIAELNKSKNGLVLNISK